MLQHLWNLWHDDRGFLVSAELVIIATLLVIGLVVGLAEVQNAVVGELNDVGEAIGSLNQSYFVHGHSSFGFGRGLGISLKSFTRGSYFVDSRDDGDWNQCAISCDTAVPEAGGRGALGRSSLGSGLGGAVDCALGSATDSAAECAVGGVQIPKHIEQPAVTSGKETLTPAEPPLQP